MKNQNHYQLFLFIALLLGGILRFLPPAMAGFPVNDGGMFYVMVDELKANHFALPAFTQYNLSNIPFAYPPFGFYITALFSSLFHLSSLALVCWLPPLVSTLSLLAFYLMASEILRSKEQAALATIFYGLLPDSFGWAVMGGGITRAFGLLFMFLTIAFANRLFTRTRSLLAVLTALFGALAFLSHPQTGLQAASISVLLWLFRGRSKRTLLWSVGVAVGVVALTAPWWGTVLSQHGLVPFQSASYTSDDGTFHLAKLLTLGLGGGPFFSLTVAFGLVGLLAKLAQKHFLLPVWILLPFFVDPRSAGGMALIAMSMLAGFGFDAVIAPALRSLRGGDSENWLADRFVVSSLLVMAFYLFFGAAVFDLELAGNSLSAADRETIAWVDKNISPGNVFILLTGEQYSMNDPFQEWFPALTEQRSLTTLQGKEWTLAENFFPFYGELVSLQHCSDIICIEAWGNRTGLDHDYLLMKKMLNGNVSPLSASLELMLKSARESQSYQLVYETDNAVIFEKVR